jgi:acetyl-CoA C-acetyltransferase
VNDVVICEPVRTPVGRYGGVLRDVSAADLAATVVRAVVERTGLDGISVDDVILGQCYPNGEAPGIGRVAALNAGLPSAVTGLQLDRRCGSGVQALLYAVMQVGSGMSKVVLAGGVESMSQAEYYSVDMRCGARTGNKQIYDRLARGRVIAGGVLHQVPGGMIETAENLRREYGISREQQDEFALSSHHKAVAAQQGGRFDDEIVPVEIASRQGTTVMSVDENPRADVTLAGLAALRPVMSSTDEHATVTAGNASGQNDGASLALVTTRDIADRLGSRPMARLVSCAVAGVPPRTMGIGPVPAVAAAFERSGLGWADIDLIELNEAFAAQVLACTKVWNFTDKEFERLNVNGSGISLGHPVGATGDRILASLLRELERREARYGLETLCIGGGQGIAAIFERIPS